MKVRDVCLALDRVAPPKFAYEWDRSGLNIGSMDAEVSVAIVALSVTQETFEAARQAGAQMIVSHHPVVWDALRVLRTDDPHTQLCLKLAQAGIACYSAHTNLDVVPGGVNEVLAARLGLTGVRPLISVDSASLVKLVTFVPEGYLAKVRDAVCEAGAGVIGDYTYCTFGAAGKGTFLPGSESNPFLGQKQRLNEEPEIRFETVAPRARLSEVVAALRNAHPYETPAYDVVVLENRDETVGLGARGELAAPMALREFADFVRERLETSHVRVVDGGRAELRTVAVLGGSGGGEVGKVPADVDVYVTGDVRYHDALTAAERGLSVIDAGHVGTEKWIVPVLRNYLSRSLPDVEWKVFDEPDPFEVTRA